MCLISVQFITNLLITNISARIYLLLFCHRSIHKKGLICLKSLVVIMKQTITNLITVPGLVIFSGLTGFSQVKQSRAGEQGKQQYYSLRDFPSVKKFDSHVHFNKEDTTFLTQAKADNFQLLTINVDTEYYPPITEQRKIGYELIKKFPDRISFATTFSVKDWGSDEWQKQTLDYLQQSFEQGAIAVKLWKNIGMGLKDKDGKFIMIDDPRFDPVLDFIAKNRKTLIGHFGEPRNCWLPVEKMTVGNDKRYFTAHPEYHMYLHPENPSYEDQVKARDHMLEKHPDLTFVGAHLGSLEWNVDELARRLDKYPNMAVDMAARISHLQHQAVSRRKKVRDFMVKYQDRLIYATDLSVEGTRIPAERNSGAHNTWLNDWKFFVTDAKMKVPHGDGEFMGLKLPKNVIDKIFYTNAQKWVLQKRLTGY